MLQETCKIAISIGTGLCSKISLAHHLKSWSALWRLCASLGTPKSVPIIFARTSYNTDKPYWAHCNQRDYPKIGVRSSILEFRGTFSAHDRIEMSFPMNLSCPSKKPRSLAATLRILGSARHTCCSGWLPTAHPRAVVCWAR